MVRFTMSNTEGYTEAQLAELNTRYEAAMSNSPDDGSILHKSLADHTAERILADYDTECSA